MAQHYKSYSLVSSSSTHPPSPHVGMFFSLRGDCSSCVVCFSSSLPLSSSSSSRAGISPLGLASSSAYRRSSSITSGRWTAQLRTQVHICFRIFSRFAQILPQRKQRVSSESRVETFISYKVRHYIYIFLNCLCMGRKMLYLRSRDMIEIAALYFRLIYINWFPLGDVDFNMK